MIIDFSGARWRKTRHSNGQGSCVEVANAWRKSSHSDGQAECVEVGTTVRVVAVRDSKDPDGPRLPVTREGWLAFTARVKTGDLADDLACTGQGTSRGDARLPGASPLCSPPSCGPAPQRPVDAERPGLVSPSRPQTATT
jgi:hypothetical protein